VTPINATVQKNPLLLHTCLSDTLLIEPNLLNLFLKMQQHLAPQTKWCTKWQEAYQRGTQDSTAGFAISHPPAPEVYMS